MKFRRVTPLPCTVHGAPASICVINSGMSFSGNWRGPYVLLPRVMMMGTPYALPYARTYSSAAALLAEYGLLGFRGALLDAAGVHTAALVGHSWGSLIALEAAARLQQRVSHLVLVGCAYPMKVSPALLESSLNEPEKALRMINVFSRSTLSAPPSVLGPGTWVFGSGMALGRRVLRPSTAPHRTAAPHRANRADKSRASHTPHKRVWLSRVLGASAPHSFSYRPAFALARFVARAHAMPRRTFT